MNDLLLSTADSDGPASRRISAALVRAIESGAMPVGTRLPSERKLAYQLRTSRATVVAAYEELRIKGLLCRQVGRGSYVSGAPVASEPFCWTGKLARSAVAVTSAAYTPEVVGDRPHESSLAFPFHIASPATDIFPPERYMEAVSAILSRTESRTLGPFPIEGCPALREAIAGYIGCSFDDVLVTAGVQQSLDLLARLFVEPKDSVIVEQPGHPGVPHVFRSNHARLAGWNAPAWDVEELQHLIVRHRPKLIYTNPSSHNPTGATMDVDTRRELLLLASSHALPVIEDDTYSLLHWKREAPRSLHQIDSTGAVIRVGSFSRLLAPGIRVGYVIAPPSIRRHLAAIRTVVAGPADAGMQQVVAELLRTGFLQKHIDDLRREHKLRFDTLIRALDGLDICRRRPRPDGGIHAWIELGEESTEFVRKAARAGVGVSPGSNFYPVPTRSNHIRMCFAGLRPAEILAGVARLKTIARTRTDRMRATH